MKLFKHTIALLLFTLSLAGCISNEPVFENFPGDQVAFSYFVDGNYKNDYLVGSKIQFKNCSEAPGACVWDFGDGSVSNKDINPSHLYKVAGTYDVTLTIDGVGKLTKKILISDIFPTITIDPIEGGVCEVNKVPVHFSVSLPNPQNLPVEFTWVMPDGTTDASGKDIAEFKGANPGNLLFKNIGSQSVVLKTTLGGRSLTEVIMNVQVGTSESSKTLYYAVKGGNIMALKLVRTLPQGTKNNPFDLGVKSGQHPFNLLFDEGSLYVLDAGKQFTYIDDKEGVMGDGAINVIAADGSKVETLLNNSKEAFNDPYFGWIDGGNIYFSDRNTGISKLSKETRNNSMDRKDPRFSYFVQNDRLKYYKVGYDYGAMNACIAKVGDTWWWSKVYSGMGIFRFKESDISATSIANGEKDSPYPVLASGFFIKSFVVDQARNMVYYIIRDKGFYKATLADFTTPGFISGANPGTLVQAFISDSDGSSGEFVDVCQMALDAEDGSVYFGYRRDAASNLASGLKRYNPATNKIESIIDNVEIYGITINNIKSKLF